MKGSRLVLAALVVLAMVLMVAVPASAQLVFDRGGPVGDRFLCQIGGDIVVVETPGQCPGGNLIEDIELPTPLDFSIEQETEETGDVDLTTEVANTGDSSNQCAAPLQFGNTGNNQNAQGFSQFDSEADDIEFEGSTFEFTPEQAVECDQAVEQAAAASS